MRNLRPAVLTGLTLALALQACGDDGASDDAPAAATAENAEESTSEDAMTTETTEGDTAGTEEDPEQTGDDEESEGAVAGPGGGGSATLTIGDMVYEFDNYYCVSGADTGNSRVSFSSGAMGEVDGVRVQLDASIQDPSEQGMTEGEGTLHSVTLDDIEDFEDPSVSWAAVTGFVGAPSWVVVSDGSTVTVEAAFDDGTTDEIEEVPGTLEASCGS